MPTICFDPISGASGNMILGALFDLGADVDAVDRAVRSSGLHGFELTFAREPDSNGIMTGYCAVHVHHDDDHDHGDGNKHHHHHRHLGHILEMIDRAEVADRAKDRARRIFERLGDAEAAVHGIPVEEVHFHEVGAVDSIVDIFGTCVALELLDIEHVYCSAIKVGKGTLRCAHGVLPVPAPATAKLIEGFPVRRLDIQSELTTPTGAAILTTLSEGDWAGIEMRMLRCGVGRGTRKLEQIPNVIRAFLCDVPPATQFVEVIETDIDDDTPERLALVADLLLGGGALDVTSSSVAMKKGRVGTRLSILARAGDSARLADLVFRHSSTIGVRVMPARRYVLPREAGEVQTPWGAVRVKRIVRPDGVDAVPEFESCRQVAEAAGVPIRRVMLAASGRS